MNVDKELLWAILREFCIEACCANYCSPDIMKREGCLSSRRNCSLRRLAELLHYTPACVKAEKEIGEEESHGE